MLHRLRGDGRLCCLTLWIWPATNWFCSGSRDFAFAGALEILSLRLRWRMIKKRWASDVSGFTTRPVASLSHCVSRRGQRYNWSWCRPSSSSISSEVHLHAHVSIGSADTVLLQSNCVGKTWARSLTVTVLDEGLKPILSTLQAERSNQPATALEC